MNMKKIIPGLLATFILLATSSANAGGNVNWSFSINLNQGHPTLGVYVGHNRRHISHQRARWHKRAHKRRHHQRRHAPVVVRYHNYGHKHGHRYHVHHHRGSHRHW